MKLLNLKFKLDYGLIGSKEIYTNDLIYVSNYLNSSMDLLSYMHKKTPKSTTNYINQHMGTYQKIRNNHYFQTFVEKSNKKYVSILELCIILDDINLDFNLHSNMLNLISKTSINSNKVINDSHKKFYKLINVFFKRIVDYNIKEVLK